MPMDIGGTPFPAQPAPRALPAGLTPTEEMGVNAFKLRQSTKYRKPR